MQSNSFDSCIHHYNVEILNIFDPELQLLNTKSMIKNKLKELLAELKKFQVQTILGLDYKKENAQKTFHPSPKLTASDSGNDQTFKFIHQSVMIKIKNYACKDRFALDVIIYKA